MEKKPTTRHRSSVGDIFAVNCESGDKRYLQFIGRDKTFFGFGGDVVRVFKKAYGSDENPDLNEIAGDDVDFYAHLHHVTVGLKQGLWVRVGNLKSEMGNLKPIFYQAPADSITRRIVESVSSKKPSSEWTLWQMDGESWEGTVEDIFKHSADKGGVMPPQWIYDRIKFGKYLISDPTYIR